MKNVFFLFCLTGILFSCKPINYYSYYGQMNQTQVVLSNANFTVLGSFSGTVTEKKSKINIKNMEGLITKAKENFLIQAKKEGIELTGSRTIINVTTDVVEHYKKITVTFSAEIIEFIK